MADKLQTVWITEASMFAEYPKIQKYQAVRIRTKSVTVLIRGTKRVIPLALSRKFWTDEKELIKYCSHFIWERIKSHKRLMKRLEGMLKTGLPIEEVPHLPQPHQRIVL